MMVSTPGQTPCAMDRAPLAVDVARERLRRRAFLRRAAGCGLLLSLPALAACKRDPPAAPAAEPPSRAVSPVEPPSTSVQWKFYTPEQGRTLSAIVDRLLPDSSDVGMPGAGRAGVAAYIDGQLSLPIFAGLERMMRAGVQFVDRAARRDHGGPFAGLSPQAQDALLSGFQTGAIGGMRFPQAAFFDQLLHFSLEGYLGAPEHGGNRDAVAWQALGIDPRCHNMYERCS